MYVSVGCRCPWTLGKGIGYPGARVTGGHEISNMDQKVLITTEPSSQEDFRAFLKNLSSRFSERFCLKATRQKGLYPMLFSDLCGYTHAHAPTPDSSYSFSGSPN